jgi:hypothetical protein
VVRTASRTVSGCLAVTLSQTTPIPLEGVEWGDSFIAATTDFIEKLNSGGQPRLDGPTGKAVLQFTLAALQSAATGKEVRPDEVR